MGDDRYEEALDIIEEDGRDIAQLKAENARFRAIVDQLPKTADGVPVVPGMRVWLPIGTPLFESKQEKTRTLSAWRTLCVWNGLVGIALGDPGSSPWAMRWTFLAATVHPERCYSTREAAEAAGG